MIKHLKNRWLINKVISPPGSQAKTQHVVPGFLFFNAFKIHFDKRLKTKISKIAQQFWVLACYEQIHGKTL
jgi:hypothetical protein